MLTNFIQFVKENFSSGIYDFHKDELFHNFIYDANTDTDKKVKQFNKWLKEHQLDYCYMYHGTDGAIPIEQQGIKRTSAKTKKSYQSAVGFVYLSIYPSMARTFAEIAYPYSKDIAVYRVMVQIGDLLPDKDQLRNKRLYSNMNLGDTLAESIMFGSGARVKTDINPNTLTRM